MSLRASLADLRGFDRVDYGVEVLLWPSLVVLSLCSASASSRWSDRCRRR